MDSLKELFSISNLADQNWVIIAKKKKKALEMGNSMSRAELFNHFPFISTLSQPFQALSDSFLSVNHVH